MLRSQTWTGPVLQQQHLCVSVNLLHCLIRVTAPDQLLQLRIKTLKNTRFKPNMDKCFGFHTNCFVAVRGFVTEDKYLWRWISAPLQQNTVEHVLWIWKDHQRGMALPWRCCVLPGHHSCHPSCDLLSGSSKNARQILPALWRRPETHTVQSTLLERKHRTPTGLHISVLTALKDSLCSVGGAPLLLPRGL